MLIADLWAECQTLGFMTMKREYWLVIGTLNRKESDLKVRGRSVTGHAQTYTRYWMA